MNKKIDYHTLVIAPRMPTPFVDAGSKQMVNFLRLLKEVSSTVTFIPVFLGSWPPFDKTLSQDTEFIINEGVQVPDVDKIKNVTEFISSCENDYNLVVLSDKYTVKKHSSEVRKKFPKAQVVFDTQDLHYVRYFREAKARGSVEMLKRAMISKGEELEAVNNVDSTIVVSTVEKNILHKECPGASVHKIYYLQDIYEAKNPYENRQGIMFIGSFFHTPNLDAIDYFIKDIFPLVLQKIPDIKLYLIGAAPPEHITKLQSENIIVTGFVPELRTWYEKSRLSIAPLRFGAGVKQKVLESLSYSLPVVGTS
ncbi:glycosyltransferase, partial [Candidatus Margulisiibacteriota bacterium]